MLRAVNGVLPTGINTEALQEWEDYRKEKKKPLSQLALKKSINFLLKYPTAHQQIIIDTAIMNDWQGLHPIKIEEKTSISDLREALKDL